MKKDFQASKKKGHSSTYFCVNRQNWKSTIKKESLSGFLFYR